MLFVIQRLIFEIDLIVVSIFRLQKRSPSLQNVAFYNEQPKQRYHQSNQIESNRIESNRVKFIFINSQKTEIISFIELLIE
jgi:hypothetical protein